MSMRASSTAPAPSAEDVVQKIIELRDGTGRRLPLVVSNAGEDVVLSLGINPQTTTVLTPAGAEQLGMALLSASGRWRSLDGLAEAPPPAPTATPEGHTCSGCGCVLNATTMIWNEGSRVYCDHACKVIHHGG